MIMRQIVLLLACLLVHSNGRFLRMFRGMPALEELRCVSKLSREPQNEKPERKDQNLSERQKQ
jgi:hypothetical protein